MATQKSTSDEKRALIRSILTSTGTEERTSSAIQKALRAKFGSEVHSSVIRQERLQLGIKPSKKTKAYKKKGKRPYNKRPKLTDEQIKLMVGVSSALPPNIAKVAARLRNLLNIHHVEFITIFRDKPNVRFARYTESEATL